MDDEDDDDLLLACSLEDHFPQIPRSTHKKSITVSSSHKKQETWISSSFGDFGDIGKTNMPKNPPKTKSAFSTQPRKRLREDSTVQQSTAFTKPQGKCKDVKKYNSNELWADRHRPANVDDLAVHKKKIAELQDWLQHSIGRKHKHAPVLLLTGPAGAGKTATLHVLAREMSIEVQEWENPTADDFDADSFNAASADFRPVGGSVYVSQTSQFQDFLLRANRYPSLQIFNQDQLHRKLILVEEFPNVFFRNTSQFHDILRNYQIRGHGPLVFIVSDSAGGESNERLLFPKDLQSDLCIANISFNPVAPTILTKVLSKIASTEAGRSGDRLHVPSKSTVEALAAASSGDVRGAVNALQFACLKDTRDLDTLLSGASQPTLKKKSSSTAGRAGKGNTSTRPRKQTSKLRSQDGDTSLAAIGGRDTSLFLFRALGKILYCKRGDPGDYPDQPTLPEHLSHCYRDPLLIHPEDVVEKAQLSAEFFTAYLHQNYLDFYANIDDVVTASDYLSDADHLTTDWANRTVLREYAASVAARSIMFSNSARSTSSGGGPSGLGWKPLHKPKWFEINRKCRRNKEAATDLFRANCWTPEELFMNFIPYLSLTKVHLRGPDQMSFVKELSTFDGKQLFRVNSERLDEDDVALLGSDDDESSTTENTNTSASPGNSEGQTAAMVTEDEEVVIEDFDD